MTWFRKAALVAAACIAATITVTGPFFVFIEIAAEATTS